MFLSRLLLVIFTLTVGAFGGSADTDVWAQAQQVATQPLKGTLTLERVSSVALKNNLLGDSPDRAVYVYTPPSYSTGSDRYPVVYFLHGYTGQFRSSGTSTQPGGALLKMLLTALDQAIASGSSRELILVIPDGGNRLGGAFYADSVAAGNWEQHIVDEIVQFVDGKYRSLAASSSRGLAGHSMGGNGSIRLAMKHPDVFGAVYGLSACCMTWTDDFSLANPVWHQTLGIASAGDFGSTPFLGRAFLAMATAWSPNPTRPPFYADFPVRKEGDQLVPITAVAARWSLAMPVSLVGQYRENLRRLRGVALDVGRQDQFPHIVTGARMFDAALTQNGIAHAFEEYDGDHANRVPERFATRALPFFSQRLEFSAPGQQLDVPR